MSLFKRVIPGEAQRELDGAGTALRDRLVRLGAKKSSAYTALSLLKGYGSFKTGACLELHGDGSYKSYALVGLGIAKLSVSLAGLLREDQAFVKVPNPGSLDLQFVQPDTRLWLFALDDFDPCRRLLLAVEENGSAFKAEAIASVIAETNEVFFPSAAQAESAPEGFDLELPGAILGEGAGPESPEPAPRTAGPPPELPGETPETGEGIRAEIAGYQRSNAVFQGILLEVPGGAQAPGASFAAQVAAMTEALGPGFSLPSGRVLILLPPRFDRELVAHRLSMSFVTEVLACFEAGNPDQALECIRPYL